MKSAELFNKGPDGFYSALVLKADRDFERGDGPETDPDWWPGFSSESNLTFIANARQDLPRLVADLTPNEARQFAAAIIEAADWAAGQGEGEG
jgi:hypothetical protein